MSAATEKKLSMASALASLTKAERQARLQNLTDEQAAQLRWHWEFWARDDQLAPDGNWTTWLVLAGRGWGKTRCGAEWVRQQIESGQASRVALVAPTAADARDVMIEGSSGILAVHPPWSRPLYEPSKRRLTWPNGAIATAYSADEPDRLRGPQHDSAWCDELASWRYPDAWDQLRFGLRGGLDPRVVITTTPRPTAIIKALMSEETTTVTRGTTYDNRANLPADFFAHIVSRYEGTRLGRQEIHADILEDVVGALWNRAMIDDSRVAEAPALDRIVVAIDPAMTSGESSDETGIVVAGAGPDGHAYVLEDLSCRESPDGWARRAVAAYHAHKADRVVAEVNNGGDLVEQVIRTVDPLVAYTAVHASRGKVTRAEPVAALYEQGRVHHVGTFAELEDQQCSFAPQGLRNSPDHVDALCWAITELMLNDVPCNVLDIDPATLGAGWCPNPWRFD